MSHDLRHAFPDIEFVQQAVGQLLWSYNLVLLTKLKTVEERLAYAQKAFENGWSRNVMVKYMRSWP